LIATSVAEEGLDIGEVDLIICYDIASTSPIKMIQRFGRTGRKREGKIIVLAGKGEEKSKYFAALKKFGNLSSELLKLSNVSKSSKFILHKDNYNILTIANEIINNIEYVDVGNHKQKNKAIEEGDMDIEDDENNDDEEDLNEELFFSDNNDAGLKKENELEDSEYSDIEQSKQTKNNILKTKKKVGNSSVKKDKPSFKSNIIQDDEDEDEDDDNIFKSNMLKQKNKKTYEQDENVIKNYIHDLIGVSNDKSSFDINKNKDNKINNYNLNNMFKLPKSTTNTENKENKISLTTYLNKVNSTTNVNNESTSKKINMKFNIYNIKTKTETGERFETDSKKNINIAIDNSSNKIEGLLNFNNEYVEKFQEKGVRVEQKVENVAKVGNSTNNLNNLKKNLFDKSKQVQTNTLNNCFIVPTKNQINKEVNSQANQVSQNSITSFFKPSPKSSHIASIEEIKCVKPTLNKPIESVLNFLSHSKSNNQNNNKSINNENSVNKQISTSDSIPKSNTFIKELTKEDDFSNIVSDLLENGDFCLEIFSQEKKEKKEIINDITKEITKEDNKFSYKRKFSSLEVEDFTFENQDEISFKVSKLI